MRQLSSAQNPHGAEHHGLQNDHDQGQVEDAVGAPRGREHVAGEGREHAGAHAAADEEDGGQPTGDVALLCDPRVAGAELPRHRKTHAG